MGTLAATSLVKQYGKRTVVKDVSLEVARGEVVGLLGPNGAGKTTSFYMIVGLIPADEGVVMLNGKEITQLPMHVRARRGLGYLAQEPSVFRRLSVEDNLLAILETRKELEKSQQQELCDDLLRQFGLSALRESLAMRLSGGERRRLEIARSLTMEPAFILLDEPFAGIDPISISDIQSIIRQLASEGIGILITDHNVRETLGICHRGYIINNGEVLARGEPRLLLDNPDVRDVYLGHDFRM
jgi:lipopolysaccharide export system ATP-binding protein